MAEISLADSITILGNTINDLGDVVKEFKSTAGGILSILDEANTSLIGLGKAYQPQFDKFSKNFSDLPGSIGKNFQLGVDQLLIGFRGLNEGVLKQTVQERLTGQNAISTIKSYKDLQFALGLSNNAISELADYTLELSKTYNVQTSELTQALKALSPELQTLSIFGVDTTKLSKNIEEAAAIFGPGAAPILTQFVKSILSESHQTA